MKAEEIVDEIKRILKKRVKKVGDFQLKQKLEKPSVPKPIRRNTLRASLDAKAESRLNMHSSALNIYRRDRNQRPVKNLDIVDIQIKEEA